VRACVNDRLGAAAGLDSFRPSGIVFGNDVSPLPEGLRRHVQLRRLRLLSLLLCLLLYARSFWRREAAELEDKT